MTTLTVGWVCVIWSAMWAASLIVLLTRIPLRFFTLSGSRVSSFKRQLVLLCCLVILCLAGMSSGPLILITQPPAVVDQPAGNVFGALVFAMCLVIGVQVSWFRSRIATLRNVRLFRSGQYPKLLARYDRQIFPYTRNWAVWQWRALALQELDRDREALACWNQALEIVPRRPGLWLSKANALLSLHRYEEALAALDQTLARAPKQPDAWIARAYILERMDRPEEALAACAQTGERQNTSGVVWQIRAAALDHLGRYDEALKAVDRALRLEGWGAATVIVRASVLAHLNRDAEAREAAEQALAIADASLTKRPRYIAAWDAKAAAFRLLGRDDETRAAEERIAALLG